MTKQSRKYQVLSFQFRSISTGLALLALASACGGQKESTGGSQRDANSDSTGVSALVASVVDGCGLETYVGPNRGRTLAWLKYGIWEQEFSYSSALGYGGTSGFEEHRMATNGELTRDPRCESLKGVFLAQSVDGQPLSERKYDLRLEIEARAEGFPATSEEAWRTPSLAATTQGALVIRVIKPCESGVSNCWQEDKAAQRYSVKLECESSSTLSRQSGPFPSGLSQDEILGLYSMPFPDRCSFAVQHAVVALADGSTVRASFSGTAAKEAAGAFLRIKRIAIEQ